MRFNSISELMMWIREASRLWLFLNYEGALEQFTPTRFDNYPNIAILQALQKLSLISTIRTAILSGRKLEQLRQLVPVRGIFLTGSYGIEILTPQSETIHRLNFESIRPMLEMVKPQWSRLLRGKKGFFLDDKGWRLAIHARFADELDTEQVFNDAQRVDGIESLSRHFQIQIRHNFLEIVPQLANKRQTIAYLLDAFPFENARLLYIGNNDKEEDTIPFIHANKGIAVKVLQPSYISQTTDGDFSFQGPKEALNWLSELI